MQQRNQWIALRTVMEGTQFWHGCPMRNCTDPDCGKNADGTRTSFTFGDFVSEIVVPDLEISGLLI